MVNNDIKTDVRELTFKKGEKYKGKHIYINNDRLFVSDEFANYLVTDIKERSNRLWHSLSFKSSINYGYMYKCSLLLKHVVLTNNPQYTYELCGLSGSYGFGGLEYTKKETLGVRTRRRANKHIIKLYLESKFSRLEKLKYLKEKWKNSEKNDIKN
jgi:hypothetical protein